MTFDPKAYLAARTGIANAPVQGGGSMPAPAQPSFDPKAYLAKKSGAAPTAQPVAAQTEAKGKTGVGESYLQGFGQGGTFGYLPELQAQAGYYGGNIAEALGGPNADTLDQLRDYFGKRNTQIKEEHPIAYGAGDVTGAVATTPIVGAGLARAGGLAARGASAIPLVADAAAGVAEYGGALKEGAKAIPYAGKLVDPAIAATKASAEGAGYGGAMNPDVGHLENSDDPYAGLKKRMENAKVGAEVAGTLNVGGQALKGAVVKYMSGASGVPEKAVKGYLSHQDEVKNLIENEGGADYATQVHEQLQDKFFAKKREIGNQIGEAIKNGKGKIDSDAIFKPYDDLLAKLKASKNPPEDVAAIEAEINSLKNTYLKKTEAVPVKPTDSRDALFQKMGVEKPQVQTVETPLTLSAEDAFNLKSIAGNNANLHNVSGTFRSRYPKASSNIDKMWSNANLEARKVADKQIQSVADTSGLNQQYAKFSRLQDKMERHFADPEKTLNTLSGIEAPSKEFARDTVKQVKTELGVDLQKPSEVLEAYRYFRKPAKMPISSEGTTSTSRTLTLGGLGAAAGSVFGPLGSAAGSAIGLAAHSPAATKQYLNLGKALQTNGAPVAGALGGEAAKYNFSPWERMNNGR